MGDVEVANEEFKLPKAAEVAVIWRQMAPYWICNIC